MATALEIDIDPTTTVEVEQIRMAGKRLAHEAEAAGDHHALCDALLLVDRIERLEPYVSDRAKEINRLNSMLDALIG